MDIIYRLGDSIEARYSSKTTSTFFIFGVDTIAKGPAWTKRSAEGQKGKKITWCSASSLGELVSHEQSKAASKNLM